MFLRMKPQLALKLCLLGSIGMGTAGAITSPRIEPASYVVGPDPSAILMTFANGPDTRGFAWQTDDTVTGGELRVVPGVVDASAFDKPGVVSVSATSVNKSEDLVKIICHKAQMTGLSAGTYSYRLGAPSHYAYGTFAVRAAESTAPVTIVTLSDAQPRSADKVVVWENTVSNAAAKVAALGLTTDLVLTGGDLFDVNWFYSQDAHAKDANYWFQHQTYGAFGTSAGANYKYNYWKWGLDLDVATPYFPGVPWALASGNHDCEGVNSATGTANGDIYYQHVTAVNWASSSLCCHSFNLGNVHVVVLPCLSRGDNASLYTSVKNWVENDLAAAQTAGATDWTVVEMHWGPYTTGDHGKNADPIADLFAPVFSQYHVDLVIQAHDHTFSKTLPYRWDAAGVTSSATDNTVINLNPATTTVGGETYDLNPQGTYYVICGSSGHRVGEDGTTYVGTTGASSYTTRSRKVAVGKITQTTAYAHAGDDASQNPNASMFGVLRVAGGTLAYDFYAVATDGLSAPVLFDTLRVCKVGASGPPVAGRFLLTPYVQHPATNAMSVLWFTDTPCDAVISWWPVEGGSEQNAQHAATTGVWASALTNNVYNGESTSPSKYRHRHRIEGLAPGTRYAYAVELTGGERYTNTFKTAPDANASVRFIYYNDSETEPSDLATGDWTPPDGVSRANTYFIGQNTGYASNIVMMASREPDFYAIAGDLAAQGGRQLCWDEFWKHNAGGVVGGRKVGHNDPAGSTPIFAAIGNHDLQDVMPRPAKAVGMPTNCENYGGGESALERYLSYFEYEPNGVDFTDVDARDRSQMFHRVDYGPVTMIFLDTNNGDDSDFEKDTNTGLFRDPAVAGSYGLPAARSADFNPGSRQYAWLTNQLADAQLHAKFTFVVNHQCPYSVGYHNRKNVQESGEWLSARALRVLGPTLVKYGVAGWLCGHDEMVEHTRISGEEVLPDGTTRPHSVDIFDMGTAGDGLRGGEISNEGKNLVKTTRTYEDGTPEIFRAHVDAPEVWENGVLVSGGKHYGHMEVNVAEVEPGLWTATLEPVYMFVSKNAQGKVQGFERRVYDDVVVLTNKCLRLAPSGGNVIVIR